MSVNNKKMKGKSSFIEILFVLSFMILVGFVVYFLINGITYETHEVKYEGYYSKDQINAIMLATDNAINKISNILIIATVFFTILITSITVFQYIKIRDIDKLKDELKIEIFNERKLLDEKFEKSQETLKVFKDNYNIRFREIEEKYQEQLNKVDILIIELQNKIDIFNFKSVKLEIDTNYVKAKGLEASSDYLTLELINIYEEIKNLIEQNQGIKSNEFISKVYIDLVESYLSLDNMVDKYDYLKSTLNKAIELTNDPITEISAYKVFVSLEEIYYEGLGNKIEYLEKIHKMNRFDYKYTLKLADAYDFRNEYDDLNKTIYYIENSISYHKELAIDYCLDMIENGYFRNSIRSNEHRGKIEKIIGKSIT